MAVDVVAGDPPRVSAPRAVMAHEVEPRHIAALADRQGFITVEPAAIGAMSSGDGE